MGDEDRRRRKAFSELQSHCWLTRSDKDLKTSPSQYCSLHASRRLTHDQLRLQHHLGRVILVGLANSRNQAFARLPAHLLQRLANGCEARRVETSHTNIIEANNRDILRAVEAEVGKRPDSSDRRRVVECADRRKTRAHLDQFSHLLEREFRGELIVIHLEKKFGLDLDVEFLSRVEQQLPSFPGFQARALSLHEKNAPVPEMMQMLN